MDAGCKSKPRLSEKVKILTFSELFSVLRKASYQEKNNRRTFLVYPHLTDEETHTVHKATERQRQD